MDSAVRYALFGTAIGTCGIAWRDEGICAASLPEHTPGATRDRILRRHPAALEAAPGAHVAEVIDGVVRLLLGDRVDLSHAAIDESGVPEFHRQVYAITRTIQPGSTITYGEIARLLGNPLLAQQVGQALGRNPIPIITPCHRVLGANGRMVGFSAPGGMDTKRRILLIERALPDEPLSLF